MRCACKCGRFLFRGMLGQAQERRVSMIRNVNVSKKRQKLRFYGHRRDGVLDRSERKIAMARSIQVPGACRENVTCSPECIHSDAGGHCECHCLPEVNKAPQMPTLERTTRQGSSPVSICRPRPVLGRFHSRNKAASSAPCSLTALQNVLCA